MEIFRGLGIRASWGPCLEQDCLEKFFVISVLISCWKWNHILSCYFDSVFSCCGPLDDFVGISTTSVSEPAPIFVRLCYDLATSRSVRPFFLSPVQLFSVIRWRFLPAVLWSNNFLVVGRARYLFTKLFLRVLYCSHDFLRTLLTSQR